MYTDVVLSIVVVLLIIVWSMKLIHLAIKVSLTIIAVVLLLNFLGLLVGANDPMNNLIAGAPDKSCKYNNDCLVKQTHCNPCDCGEVVNKNWDKVCIFRDSKLYDCKRCPQPNVDYTFECKSYECIIIEKQ